MVDEYRLDVVGLATPAGTNLYAMQRLACMAALDHRCTATFVHNDELYEVTYESVLRCCALSVKQKGAA